MNNNQADILHLCTDIRAYLSSLYNILDSMQTEALINEEPNIYDKVDDFKHSVNEMLWRLNCYS